MAILNETWKCKIVGYAISVNFLIGKEEIMEVGSWFCWPPKCASHFIARLF
jgi:hypothetical protein